ncbi:MAG: UDP-N-acetylmuramate dehydrogenase [Dissulfurimicrobium sp.]|uniref:UDP-N-acetylmuramate dehydrogenase n=1 Tax=Dissulfurimicrobium TaxID=1769732 RepID=UPI003C70D1F1
MPFRDLAKIDGIELFRDLPLAPLTTFRIGGRAKIFVRPRRIVALEAALACLQDKGVAYKILGRGSNLLIDDKGVEAVISLAALNALRDLVPDESGGSILTVEAGHGLGRLISWTSARGLSGLEGLCGIPGSVGGAVKMNAGAGTWCIAHILHSVCFTGPGGSCWVSGDRLEYGYRSLEVPSGAVVSMVRLRLFQKERSSIYSEIRALMKKRTKTQPLGRPSAGCIFKNPPGDSAGRLIDLCGLKGLAVGGAEVSFIHANFIINRGGASSADVIRLMDIVKDTVRSITGIELAPEVAIWGMRQ